jgi:integrase
MTSIAKRITDGAVRYDVRYRTPSRESRRKSFARKIDAERFKTQIDNAKDTGAYVDPSRAKITVGPWSDMWLDAQADLSPTTRNRYEGIIARHIRPGWGNVQLASVTHAEVQRWLTGLHLAPASVRKVHRVLSMVLAYAVKDGRLAVNPAAGVSLPRVHAAEKRFLTHAQVAELADVVGPEYRLMVLFLSYTGVRWVRWQRFACIESTSCAGVCSSRNP